MVNGEDVLQTMGLVPVFGFLHVIDFGDGQQLSLRTAIACIGSMVIRCFEVSFAAKGLYRSI